MKVIRARSTNVVKLIAPHLIFTDPKLKGSFVADLIQKMLNEPESLLVLVALDEETEELRAFSIAHNPGPSMPYVILPQVWSHVENPWNWWQLFLSRVIIWAAALGKDYIRGETDRNTSAMLRKFGFEPYLQLIKLDLRTHGFQDLLMNHPEDVIYPRKKEPVNG